MRTRIEKLRKELTEANNELVKADQAGMSEATTLSIQRRIKSLEGAITDIEADDLKRAAHAAEQKEKQDKRMAVLRPIADQVIAAVQKKIADTFVLAEVTVTNNTEVTDNAGIPFDEQDTIIVSIRHKSPLDSYSRGACKIRFRSDYKVSSGYNRHREQANCIEFEQQIPGNYSTRRYKALSNVKGVVAKMVENVTSAVSILQSQYESKIATNVRMKAITEFSNKFDAFTSKKVKGSYLTTCDGMEARFEASNGTDVEVAVYDIELPDEDSDNKTLMNARVEIKNMTVLQLEKLVAFIENGF